MEMFSLGSLDILQASSDGIAQLHQSLGLVWTLLAQDVKDPNVIGQMQSAFENFVKSGQIWALIIGFVLGYGFKSLLP